jgi:hypothetical protein
MDDTTNNTPPAPPEGLPMTAYQVAGALVATWTEAGRNGTHPEDLMDGIAIFVGKTLASCGDPNPNATPEDHAKAAEHAENLVFAKAMMIRASEQQFIARMREAKAHGGLVPPAEGLQ